MNAAAPNRMEIPMNRYKEILLQLAKPFCLLLLLIMICAFLARTLSGSETLAEYAKENPSLAYGIAKEETNDLPDISDISENSAENTSAVQSGDTLSSYDKEDDTAADALSGTQADSPKEQAMNEMQDRITYQPGFFYQSLDEALIRQITGISYPMKSNPAEAASTEEKTDADAAVSAINIISAQETPAVAYDELRYVRVLYNDFSSNVQEGELICNQAIAQDLVEIFYALYQSGYQIEKIRLIDEYNGDDTLSMTDNNTSCFNYRVVDGTDSLSKHAYGLAIDINPFYNPYVVYGKNADGSTYISPPGSEVYADRSKDFPYKIDENDLCYKLFKEHGFAWGGDWNSCKDYQHFQKTLPAE